MKKYKLTVLGRYGGDKILEFVYTKQLDSARAEGFQDCFCEAEDGRTLFISTRDTIFIEELKNDET